MTRRSSRLAVSLGRHIMGLAFLLGVVAFAASAQEAGPTFRFPMPEFESGYTHPELQVQQPDTRFENLDVLFLALALCMAAWLVLKRRSRREIFLLTVACLLYFGFLRKGCVCAVGSVQNVADAGFHAGVGLPLTVLAFFLLPLLFALFFGRVFCAAVCPLGAAQEAVAVKSYKVPQGVARVLELFPPIYLGLAILAVATNSGYLICRYDPFVGFFRMGAGFNMLIAGGIVLLVGVFFFRPYCRFLCPYAVLLNWCSRFSKWHATVTPAECIQCRLCEDSCPFDAIEYSTPGDPPEPRKQGARRTALLIVLVPLLVAACAGTGWLMHDVLSRLHPTVRLAERVAEEALGYEQEMTVESETFRAGEKTRAELYEEAAGLKEVFKLAGTLFGAFVGLVLGVKLVHASVLRRRTDYEPNKGTCLSCGRCFAYCPVEKEG